MEAAGEAKVVHRKIAVVTGGASGLGSATAKRLAEDRAEILVADLKNHAADAIARDIAAGGQKNIVIPCGAAGESFMTGEPIVVSGGVLCYL